MAGMAMSKRVQFGASMATSTARASAATRPMCARRRRAISARTDVADPGLVVGRRQGGLRSDAANVEAVMGLLAGSEPLSALSDWHGLSCARGAGPPVELRRRNVDRTARTGAPDRPALITADGVRTYAALAERDPPARGRIPTWASGMAGSRGSARTTAFLEALFAAGRIGAVLAPVNHYLPADERAAVVADADPAVVLEHAALPKPRSRHRSGSGSPWVAPAPARWSTNR